MKIKIHLLLLFLPITLFGQKLIDFDLPKLNTIDTVSIFLKRGNYEEKVIIYRVKEHLRVTFFRKTVVLSLKDSTQLSKNEIRENINLINEFNKKIYSDGEQFLLKNGDYTNSDFFYFNEVFILVEDRFVYHTPNKIIFTNLSKLIITDQHTEIDIYSNNKFIKNFRMDGYITGEMLIFR